MDATQRKLVGVIVKYAVENFSTGDWLTLGQMCGNPGAADDHPRLFRSMSFGDDDYPYCAAQVINQVLEKSPEMIEEVVDQFDIDLWYQQKNPEKSERLFPRLRTLTPNFWKSNYLRLFLSHLSSNKRRAAQLKAALEDWGISAFIAHEDIEPSKEWEAEIVIALDTMDALAAIIEDGFRASRWTDQEIGHALGRKVDVVPLLVGAEPHGFVAKIQGINAKGKKPSEVAGALARTLMKRPRQRDRMLTGIAASLQRRTPEERMEKILELDQLITDAQLKGLLETAGLTADEKTSLADIINRVGAFPEPPAYDADDIPF